jgi:hypothetical protein
MTVVLSLLFGLVAIAALAAISLFGAFPVMLALGIIHSAAPAVPAFGFFATWVLVWAFSSVCSFLKPNKVEVE